MFFKFKYPFYSLFYCYYVLILRSAVTYFFIYYSIISLKNVYANAISLSCKFICHAYVMVQYRSGDFSCDTEIGTFAIGQSFSLLLITILVY